MVGEAALDGEGEDGFDDFFEPAEENDGEEGWRLVEGLCLGRG